MHAETAERDVYAVRRWITLVACTVSSMCCGFFYAWSVLSKPMMQMYGWSSAEVALGFTLTVVVPSVCTLLAGKLQQYMKPSTLLLAGGVVLGLGTVLLSFATSLGLLYTFAFIAGIGGITYPGATMANLMRFFPDRRGLASGILTAGFGLGAVIWGPTTVLLIDRIGFKWTLRVLGILFAVVIAVCSRLVTVAPVGYTPRDWTPETGSNVLSEEASGLDWKKMLRTPSFWLLAPVFVLGQISGMMVTAHASPIAQQKLGISATAAGAFVSYLALGMVAGKVGGGALSDRIGRSAVLTSVLAISVAALILLWQTKAYVLVVLGIFVIGLCYGGLVTLMGPVTSDAFGPKHFAVNFGIMYLTTAASSFGGPRLAAAIAQADGGDYTRAFLVAAVLTAAGLVLGCAYAWPARRRSNTRPRSPEVL